MSEKYRKPLGTKCYGHIPHIPGSRIGKGDHKCSDGQARIATEKPRDKHDRIIASEKLDGSNCGVVKLNGEIIALTRAGYRAYTSPYEQHHYFGKWVKENESRFNGLLSEGERACGEWLMQAHGTRYKLPHEPFVIFDIMRGQRRMLWDEVLIRVSEYNFIMPCWIHRGGSLSIRNAMKLVEHSNHGALDPVEGVVWRVERNRLVNKHSGIREWVFDFLVKYVRPDKEDGKYIPEISGHKAIWNWLPTS